MFTRKKSRLVLEDYAVETFSVGAGPDDRWLELTQAAFVALRKRVKNSGGPVTLVLPPHLVLTKHIKTPRVEAAKREKIIRFEAEQNIPYALSDVVWDSVVVGERAIEVEVLIAAAKRDLVESLCAAAQTAGFHPRAVLPVSLATLAGFRLAQASLEEPVLILNLGARSTTLLMAEPKRFVVRTVAIGGSGLTQPRGQSQDYAAEEAARDKPSARGAHLTGAEVEMLATRLAQEITRSVLHFKRQNEFEAPKRVFLTGGAARLAGFDAVLTEKLNVPVAHLDTLGAIEIGRAAGLLNPVDHVPTLTDLVGAASAQLCSDAVSLTLLPPELRRREKLRQRRPWFVAAAVLAMAAGLAPAWHVKNLTTEARAQAAALEAELAPLRVLDARNRASLQQLDGLKAEAAQLQAVYDRRASWLNLFADLQTRLVAVEDVWLDKFSVAAPVEAGSPVKLVVSGRMLDKTNPLSKVSPETFARMKTLLTSLVDSPFIASVEGERFDHNQPGILKFDCVLVVDPARPL